VVREQLRGLIEALLFVSPEPLSLQDLARLAQADRRMVREMLDELREHYRNRGLRIDEVAEGFCFRTNPLYGPFVRELTGARPVKLTRAQIETLAIVAYRQPITRPEIDDIRGVDSGPMLKLLLERELIRILGKKEEPGRPLLYGTSPHFLEFFGIRSLRELPTLRDFADLTEESRAAYQRILGEPVPELPFDMGGLAEGEGHLTPIQPPDPSGPPTSPGASTPRTKPPVDASQYEDDPSIPDDSATDDPEKASPPPEQEPVIHESNNVDRVDDKDDDDDEDDDDEDDDDEDDDDEDDDDEDDDDEDDDDEDDDDEDDDDE
jgi:segregation and condensation protein B